MKYPFQNIFSEFIDIIYPPRCHFCQAFLKNNILKIDDQQINVCQPCFKNLKKLTSPFCSICRKPFESLVEKDHLCENCIRRRPHFDSLGAPYLYEGILMEAIHQYKYAGKSNMANSLGPILTDFSKRWVNNDKNCLILPIPLHPKKLRERGFNQSLKLAQNISEALDIELDFLSLRRIKYTKPQTGLNRDERKKNIRKAFDFFGKKDIKGKTAILVDDVVTTGSTLNECARVLKKAGFKKVLCLVLARTSGY